MVPPPTDNIEKLKAELANLRSALEQANIATAVLRQQREHANDEVARATMANELQAREIKTLREKLAAPAPKAERAPKVEPAPKLPRKLEEAIKKVAN